MNQSKYLNKIIQGDTLKILKDVPNEFFDIGVTSPPYNKGERDKGWLVDKVKYHNITDTKDEEEYQKEQVEVLNELYRITRPGGSFFYNHKVRWLRGNMIHPYAWVCKARWVVRQEIIWYRKIAANIRGWRFWQLEERIFWLYKPVRNNRIGKELESKHALLGSVWEILPERNSKHPAPFPIELPTRCIYSVLDDKKGKVIDPYVGSGTTLVAAKLLGHQYLGIDVSPEYVKMAEERLKNAEKEKINVLSEIQKHIVRKTFQERKEKGEWAGRYKTGAAEKEQQLALLEEQKEYLRSPRSKVRGPKSRRKR